MALLEELTDAFRRNVPGLDSATAGIIARTAELAALQGQREALECDQWQPAPCPGCGCQAHEGRCEEQPWTAEAILRQEG